MQGVRKCLWLAAAGERALICVRRHKKRVLASLLAAVQVMGRMGAAERSEAPAAAALLASHSNPH